MRHEEFRELLSSESTLDHEGFSREMRTLFPGESESDFMHRLWSQSAYPFAGANFSLYLAQIRRTQEVLDSGRIPCDGCGEPAESRGMCDQCRVAYRAGVVSLAEGDQHEH